MLLNATAEKEAGAIHSRDCSRPQEPAQSTRLWRWPFAAASALALLAVLALYARDTTATIRGVEEARIMQKWLPTKQEEVLPFHKWVKAWHVKIGRLTDVVYHTYSHHPTFVKELDGMTRFLKWQIAHRCPKQVVGFDITSERVHHFKVFQLVHSAAKCQELCTTLPGCDGWTWAHSGQWKHHCWRKKLASGPYRFAYSEHVASGLPCDRREHGFWWPDTDEDLYKLPMPVEVPDFQAPYCNVRPTRQECQSPMTRSFLPWPLNAMHRQPPVECCAPVEMIEGAACASGTPVRSGRPCAGFHAADFGCCPDGQDVAPEGPSDPASMHCVMLFRAWTAEQQLVELQFRRKAGIFSCDSWAIYSNELLEIAPGVTTRRVHSPMMCELGGQFITALNLGIFLAFYRQVVLDRDYMRHAWVIKVDPDTVWSPARLRPMLKASSWGLEDDGIYFNNCAEGLHGPIEIFSTRAFLALGKAAGTCASELDGEECKDDCDGVWNQIEVCNGPCTEWWGEDIWADQCLSRFTQAKRIFLKTLLQEEHCKPQVAHWRSCSDARTVAFHPFKDPHDFEMCLAHLT